MESLDFCDFPVDFLKHLYNFAAVPDELPGTALDEPPTVQDQPSQELILNQFFGDFELSAAVTPADPIRVQVSKSIESPPISSQGTCVEASSPGSILPAPIHGNSKENPPLDFDEFAVTPSITNIQLPKPVSIAPSRILTKAETDARILEAVRDKEAEKKKAPELKAIREYNRKIRNRESAARSNLARKRRRELQRMEAAKNQRMELGKKQRTMQGGLGSVVS